MFRLLILAIPITGMIKLVFDEIPSLKPWGFLLGEESSAPRKTAFRAALERMRERRRKQAKKK